MKTPANDGQRKPFSIEAAAVILAAFAIMEATSLLKMSYTPASGLPSPISGIVRIIILATSLLGMYAILTRKAETYLATPPLILEIILGAATLIRILGPTQLSAAQTISTLTPVGLGLVACPLLLKATPKKEGNHSSMKTSQLKEVDTEYAVEAIDVTKKYVLDSLTVGAVNGLNMKIKKGEFVALMGPSGSGKSTLLNLLGALDRPSSGRILIDGVDISTLDDSGLARLRNEKIGFVFQAYNLIARSSVLRNMELPAMVRGYSKDERLKRADELLKTVRLNNKTDRKPKTLSGGEQQRVAIARAMINNPSIVMADEPTGNLDSKTGKEIMDFLRKTNVERGATVILVTHDRGVAEMADKIIHIKDGQIIEEEDVRNLHHEKT